MPKLSDKELAEQYGFTANMLNAIPELKRVFKAAVSGTWSSDKFQAKVRDTKWWKTHSSSERDFIIMKYGDPRSANQQLRNAETQARQMANSLGIVETSFTLGRIKAAAYNMTARGWSDAQVRNYLGQFVYFKNDTHQGEGGEALDKLQQLSYAMGIKNSDKWYTDRARNIVRGVATSQDYESELRKQAKSLFPQWSKQIDSGQTVMDIASPYLQSMSQILELPQGSVNLFNPTIKKALQFKDPKTGSNTVKPIWQFENDLRNDPRWKKTKNAQDSIMQVAHKVLSDFGVSY